MSIVKNPAQPSITNAITNVIAPSNASLGGGFFIRSSSVDTGLISSYSYTVGSNSPDGKNTFRGYATGQYINYGSTTAGSTFDLGDGTTISMTTVAVSSNGFATYEYIPQSGTQTFTLRLVRANSTSFPTFNDSNWFKTLRIINNTTSTTEDIARSSFSSPSLSNDGTDGMAIIQLNRTATTSTNDSITIQLRSD